MAATEANSSDDRLSIVCLHCGKGQEIAKRAMSVTCRFCNERYVLDRAELGLLLGTVGEA